MSTTSGEPQSAWLAFKIVRHAAYLLRNLGAATEALARVQAGSGPMHLSSFESLNRELENNWTIAPFWRVFHDETLQVHEDDNDHAVVCLRTTSFNQVCGAPQFFSLATRFSAYEKVPSWITGIGLIFTFGMLMRGLSTLQVLDNDTRVSGIGTLINSLSAKFSSSVTAMICSLALSILITKREHEVERARAKLTSMVDSLFKLRSVAQLSSSGNEHLERMTESVRHLSTDLGDRLSNSMTQSLGPQFDRFSKAIDSLALHKNTGVDETLQKMIESFQRTLAQSTTGDFVNLRDAMSATAQQARAAAEETRTLVSRLGEQVVQQAELARRTTQDAAESMSTLTKHYRSQTKEDTEHSLQTFEALGELVRSLQVNAAKSQEQGTEQQAALNAAMLHKIDQQVESLVHRTGESVRSQHAAHQEVLTMVVNNVGTSIAQQREEQGVALARMAQHMEATDTQRTRTGQQAITELLQNIGTQSQAMIAQMTEAAHAQREHMQRVAESTINASITSAQSTLEMANTFTKNNYQAAHALQEAAAAIAMATQAYHLALQEGEQIVSRIAGINASLTESAAQSSVTSARLTDTVSITASQQQMLTLQQKNSQALIVQAEEVFSRLQGGMGGLLTNISTHLADYQRQTQAGLQQNLQSFDTSLGSAVGSLTSVVDALAQELSILETMLHQNRLPEKFEPQP